MLSGEATNANFIVFGMTRPGLEPAIYRTRDEHATYYATDAVYIPIWILVLVAYVHIYLRIDRNFCSVHEEITSIRSYTPCNPRSGLRKGVYNLIEVISNEPNK
jgi:hypothetical protein